MSFEPAQVRSPNSMRYVTSTNTRTDSMRLSSVGDSAASLGPWLERVEPELRTWLQEELLALRQELQASRIRREEAQRRLEVPVGVDVDAWRAIAQCPTFHPLSQDAMLALAKSIQPREFRTGSVLLTSGEPSSGLYLIVEGRVAVISGEGANRHQLDTDGVGGGARRNVFAYRPPLFGRCDRHEKRPIVGTAGRRIQRTS